MGDFGDQTVSMAAVENSRHFSALTARIDDVFQMRRVFEFTSDVRIRESTDHVSAVEQSAEDLIFVARDGIERFRRSFGGDLLTGRDAIQSAYRIRWIVDLSKSSQITTVG